MSRMVYLGIRIRTVNLYSNDSKLAKSPSKGSGGANFEFGRTRTSISTPLFKRGEGTVD